MKTMSAWVFFIGLSNFSILHNDLLVLNWGAQNWFVLRIFIAPLLFNLIPIIQDLGKNQQNHNQNYVNLGKITLDALTGI